MKLQLTLLSIFALQGCMDNESKTPIIQNEPEIAIASNRVAIPEAVRANLGITFATTERRKLQDILRAPGKFEYLPSAKREYRTALSGKVELHVEQFEKVLEGTLLYTLDSSQWREIQQTIAGHLATVQKLEAKMEMFHPLFLAHEQHEYSIKVNVEMWEERIKKLEAIQKAGGGSLREFTSARAAFGAARAELADLREKDAELEASYAETVAALRAAKATVEFSLESASSMLNVPLPANSPEWWKEIKRINVTATHSGVVEALAITNGSWINEQANVLTVIQPNKLRFRASGLQSDLGVLRDGLQVNIVPPTPTSAGNAVNLQNTMHGLLQLGLTGDSNDRTIDLYVTPDSLASWARPGVTAQLEIITESTSTPELSIPLAAIQHDGLTPILFRRAPDNPNEAIRMEADLGLDDGRWVAILSGLADGDEVVLDGGFQLMLATSGSIQQGGHFHSDGTFHEGEH
ncbi:MAG TPA: HlyD family efflux transporter periplasmic adaptor subunit [Phycisphaerales bacterium]|nr:HlyD family efflux transporter periplasmic adaptor subunit [Phycisphaerales bacterium]HIB01596.1 HlyD family efflux transporter periplasmic adaptor subunit [Phycisphaerales bacterium]HIB49898.1 HlyD family efflux transporter periplasmic adaptor subunit [Phycisphaerales bacterium]HIN84659.1 HlyD family efflux transporter periplasmic adaptor subunit [Phycisphaerales bacterium]HIO19464.1 HlyD family efflux transporter periplasmic adaptor subunit [Phycisphaerales bacterium]